MCGRFVRAKVPDVYEQAFLVQNVPDMPSYNVAPTQKIAVVRMDEAGKKCVVMRWGLIPFWAKDKKTSFINSRGETLVEKPAFRAALKRRRCLILADGYFEWKPETPKKKIPYYFHLQDGGPIAFAGIWDVWKGEEEPIESCSIITTSANDLSRPIHDRMPVILQEPEADAWIDPEIDEPAALLEMLKPFPASRLACDEVGPSVNSVKNNSPECIAVVA